MVKHYNPSISEDLLRIFNFKSGDFTVSEVDATLTPVVIIQRKAITKTAAIINSVSDTLFATPSTKDFYITSAALSMIKDASATTTAISLTVTQDDGLATPILSIPSITVTAHTATISMVYPNPIKVARGSTITLTSTTNVGNFKGTGTISGYFVETAR